MRISLLEENSKKIITAPLQLAKSRLTEGQSVYI